MTSLAYALAFPHPSFSHARARSPDPSPARLGMSVPTKTRMGFGRQTEKSARLKGQFVHIEISTVMLMLDALSGFPISKPLESLP